MALITASEAKLLVPALSGTGSDTDLDTLIARADSVMAAWCGYPSRSTGLDPTLEDQTYTLRLSGPGGRDLYLPVGPIISVTSIEDDPNEAFDGSSYLVASGDYEVMLPSSTDGERIRLKTSATHGAWSNTDAPVIKAVVVAGWATIPGGLKQATAMLVRHWWDLRQTQGRQVQTQQGSTVTNREEEIPAAVRQMLAPYRLRMVG